MYREKPKSLLKSLLRNTLIVLLSAMVVGTFVQAGSLTPGGAPGATMRTLQELWDVIAGTNDATGVSANATGNIQEQLKFIRQNLGGYTFGSASAGDVLTTAGGTYNATNLSAGNVKSGVAFGVGLTGSYTAGGGSEWTYGSNDAPEVLTTADAAGTYNATNLTAGNVRSGVAFGVGSVGTYASFPGTDWVGPGSTTLTQADCENAAGWYWFEDANGDGDTIDPEDGICVQEGTIAALSFNGAEQIASANDSTGNTATGGSSNTVVDSGAGWTVNIFANMTVKITSGTAANCWGIVKSNTSDTITVYGSWRDSSYASNCGTPDATSVFGVWDDGVTDRDGSWIGDWSCTGSFPTGTVVWGLFPTSAQMGGSNIALASADCYDGQRDLLPTEADRTVLSGTATAADATTITDSSLLMRQNGFAGQKVVITGGTGVGGNARIESNTTTTITVESWTGGTPGVGSTFGVVYLIPHARINVNSDITGGDNDNFNGDRGPLVPSVTSQWKGTRLPSRIDVWGYCGYKDGGDDYENTSSAYSADKTFGTDGGQVGRTDEFLDRPSSTWMSEPSSSGNALASSSNNCTSFGVNSVISDSNIRAIFRP